MATINMHMKFEIEIPKGTWRMLRKPCRLQTDGRTDGQGESSIHPSNFVGRGNNKDQFYELDRQCQKLGPNNARVAQGALQSRKQQHNTVH